MGSKLLLVRTPAYPFINMSYAANYNKAYEELAEEHDIPLFNNFVKGVIGKSKFSKEDKIHPNEKGVIIMTNNILDDVKILIKEVECKCELSFWQKWFI